MTETTRRMTDDRCGHVIPYSLIRARVEYITDDASSSVIRHRSAHGEATITILVLGWSI